MKKYFNMKPHKIFINEAGLYELLSISTKPLAKIFMQKYFTEIMPQIRKTGKYIGSNKDTQEISLLNKKLDDTKKENKTLINNQRKIKYPLGHALYIIKIVKNNKKYYKLGYTKNLNKRLLTYNTGNLNKILYNYYIMVDNKTIDNCTKRLLENSQYIKNKEYYSTTLNKIIGFIQSCDDKLTKICCGYCNKCINFDIINQHKCKYI